MFATFLTGLGFVARPAANGFTLFVHPEPDTFVLIKALPDDEPVRAGDFAGTRHFLIWRGFLNEDEFDQFLVEAILARYSPPPEPHIRTG
jgi:hypothetical protein